MDDRRAGNMFGVARLRASAGRHARIVVRSGVIGAVVTLILIVGWRFYAGWRMGRVELVALGEPMVAQVLEEDSDTAIGEPFDIASRAVVNLPEGDYRLRVNGVGRLGRTYRFAVAARETHVHTVSIDEGRLLGRENRGRAGAGREDDQGESATPGRLTWAIELVRGRADLIEATEGSVICRNVATGKVRWSIAGPGKSGESERDLGRWICAHVQTDVPHRGLVEPAPDLNGDGTGDLVWFARDSAQMRAISGKDGSKLWDYLSLEDGLGRDVRAGGETRFRPLDTIHAGEPAVADVDLDHDGIPDLIGTFIFTVLGSGRRIVAGISGRSGRRLWTHMTAKTAEGIPWDSRRQAAVMVNGRRRALVAYSDGTKWVGLDPASGEVRVGPIDLGFIPVRPLQYADLDGDGEPEVLALDRGAKAAQKTLRAISLETGRELWTQSVDEVYNQVGLVELADRPWVVDLDGDGRSEIVVPDSGPMPPLAGYRGVRLIDGATGKTRWSRPLRPDTRGKDGLVDLAVAPDLNGDGTRDLIIVSIFDGRNAAPPRVGTLPEERRLFVDALSGKDGQPFWVWHRNLVVGTATRIWTPRWWGRGLDGWPMLALALGGGARENLVGNQIVRVAAPEVHVLEASTGRERHRVLGLQRASAHDLNGDGLVDLWGAVGDELRAVRGEAPEAWRALGQFRPPGSSDSRPDDAEQAAPDLDGDGIADTLSRADRRGFLDPQATGTHTAVARSGRDGHLLWRAVLDGWDRLWESKCRDWYDLEALETPDGDLDGDGTADIFVRKIMWEARSSATKMPKGLPVKVISGRTGALLWSAGALPPGFEPQLYHAGFWAQARAVEPGTAPDVFVRHYTLPATSVPAAAAVRMPGKPSLARISGRDGRVLWEVNLTDQAEDYAYMGIPPLEFADLNGDGALDGLVRLGSRHIDDQSEDQLQSIKLRDGTRLWSARLYQGWYRDAKGRQGYDDAEVRVGDLDGDKRPDVAVVEFDSSYLPPRAQVRALDGRDGKTRWTWKPPGDAPADRSRSIVLADFEGKGTKSVCVCLKVKAGAARIAVLDTKGKARANRLVANDQYPVLKAADVNGDGRDELFVWNGGQLHALDGELNEIWTWATDARTVDRILAPAGGRMTGAVVIKPALALDGLTGRPRWTGQASLGDGPATNSFMPEVLDPGGSGRLPLLISNGQGATVCRLAMPTTSEGRIAERRGTLVQPREMIDDDPRWMRALPWSGRLVGMFGPWGFLAATGLALVNLGVPVLISYAACGRRRRFGIRSLMMLPVAAAVPLLVYLAVVPRLAVGASPLMATEARVFLIGTLAGLPMAWGVLWVLGALVRGRVRSIAAMGALVAVTTLVVAGAWIWLDRKAMAGIEHYGWEGWVLVLLPGVCVAVVLWVVGRGISGSYSWVRRRRV
jgi:outer membrane protein assembly factor BamB